MAQLAIQGHKTRSNEVIKILEMLGGKNDNLCSGGFINRIYFINDNGYIEACDKMHHLDFRQLSLEEFLEKFPYKIGDKVVYEDKVREITKMVWEEHTSTVAYKLDDKLYCNVIKELSPYKEETMEESIQYSKLRMPLDDYDKLATEVTINGNIITPPENHLIGKITHVDNGMLVEFVKKLPKYPNTYEECCKVISTPIKNEIVGHKWKILQAFQKLLICRDAYWKVAGEQLRLDKPWKPDFTNDDEKRYGMYTVANKVVKDFYGVGDVNIILTFPTEEMRDAFYENFKDLIENCRNCYDMETDGFKYLDEHFDEILTNLKNG